MVLHLTFILLKNLYDWYLLKVELQVLIYSMLLKNVLEEFNLNLENIFGVTTDGAPAIRVLSRRALEARNFETKYF